MKTVYQRFGETLAEAFTLRLHAACPFIDEANVITEKVRPDDGLSFREAVMLTYQAIKKVG